MTILRFYNSTIFQILIEVFDWEPKILLIPSQWTENNVSANLSIYHRKIAIPSWLTMMLQARNFTSTSDICLLMRREYPKLYN